MKKIVAVNDDKFTYEIFYGEDSSVFDNEDFVPIALFSKEEAVGGSKVLLQLMDNVYYAAVCKVEWDFDSEGDLYPKDSICIWEAWAENISDSNDDDIEESDPSKWS